MAAQPGGGKWSAGGAVSSEQLSMELDHVEREIGKRTREIAMVRMRHSKSTLANPTSFPRFPPYSMGCSQHPACLL